MKKAIGISIMAVLLCAGISYADVAPGAQQAGGSLFEQMDQNGDGAISQTEFEQYSMEEGDKTQLFSTIDQDADGSITQSEWQSYESGAAGQRQMGAEEQEMGAEEQEMGSEEMKSDADTPAEERAYGPGVENQQRENLAKQMGEESNQ